MKVAVGEVLHLEDLPQRDIGDIHAEAAHAAVFVDLAAELVEKLAVDIELTAEPPIREGLAVGNGIVQNCLLYVTSVNGMGSGCFYRFADRAADPSHANY